MYLPHAQPKADDVTVGLLASRQATVIRVGKECLERDCHALLVDFNVEVVGIGIGRGTVQISLVVFLA